MKIERWQVLASEQQIEARELYVKRVLSSAFMPALMNAMRLAMLAGCVENKSRWRLCEEGATMNRAR